MDKIEYDGKGDARSFDGPEAVNVFRMAVLATALRLYANTGMRANRAYTPRNMMQAATQLTGKTFKARDYLGAAEALSTLVQVEKARLANG